ncbi:nucleosome assembly protein 1 [Striga asiatica]|uniref:Nucleosome assembly protein 1 n=1 Tax=Striga asiatica TaxID=4170 RepID=A0A5A7QFZ3_STRAF|nr:nucleosome assembly protein 1 [Striga asiatica]
MLELVSMCDEFGLHGVKAFYCSLDEINYCRNTVIVQSDLDAMNLVNFIDENRTVGVFLEHNDETFSQITERLDFVGDFDVLIEYEGDKVGEGKDSDVEAEQYVSSDSEYEDEFVDSDNYVTDEDDLLFEKNIDDDVEWGGLDMRKKKKIGETFTTEQMG